MNRHDVLMRECAGGSCFAEKAFADDRIVRQVRWESFDGDATIEPHIAREVNDPHAAATDLLFDLVLAGECASERSHVVRESRAANAAIAFRVWADNTSVPLVAARSSSSRGQSSVPAHVICLMRATASGFAAASLRAMLSRPLQRSPTSNTRA